MQHLLRGGAALVTGLDLSGTTFEQFCWDYIAIGGNHTRAELSAYLVGEVDWFAIEHDAAAHALNERCAELHLGYPIPYAHEIDR
jgi:hypothetical protein